MIDISVDGLREAEKAIADKRAEMVAQLETVVSDAVEGTQQEARSLVPVDSGELYDAIGYSLNGLQGEVGVYDVDYGAYVEFGTSKQSAQPFMLPASEVERSRLEQRIRDALG